MALELIQVCTAVDGNGVCTATAFVSGYLLPPEAEANMNLFLTGGFDSDAMMVAFVGSMLLMSVGFGVGLLVSQIRKMRV